MLWRTIAIGLLLGTLCSPAIAQVVTITHDDGAGGPATPSAALITHWSDNIFQGGGHGTLAYTGLNGANNNQWFLDTFDVQTPISDATFSITLHATPGAGFPQNDFFHLQVPNAEAESYNIGTEVGGTWSTIFGSQTISFGLSPTMIASINANSFLNITTQDDTTVTRVSLTYTHVPEPSTVVLFGSGLIGLLALARRRRG